MNAQIKGRCFKVGDEVTANQIISQARWPEARLGDWLFENLVSGAGDKAGAFRTMGCNIVVAGGNFGCGGKSNDYAVLALKDAGVDLVIAQSFNRIFYRLAIDLGLPVVLCPNIPSFCSAGDTLECDLLMGTVKKPSNGSLLYTMPLSALALDILSAGSLIDYYKAMCDKPELLFISKYKMIKKES